MKFSFTDIDMPPDSLILPAFGVDRDIPVEVVPGRITSMKESQLDRRVGGHEDSNEIALWVEYRLGGNVVHRSARVHLKTAAMPLVASAGAFA